MFFLFKEYIYSFRISRLIKHKGFYHPNVYMPGPPTPKNHGRVFAGPDSAKLGSGSSKTAYLPEYLPQYINEHGFALDKLISVGGSSNLFDYAIVSIKVVNRDIGEFIKSVGSELELQFRFAHDGYAVAVFGLELEIGKEKHRAYGKDAIFTLLEHAYIKKNSIQLNKCSVIMQRCDYKKETGITNGVGSVVNLIDELDKLLKYITGNGWIFTDFKLDNLCVCKGKLVVLDLDRKFIMPIGKDVIRRNRSIQFMALLFCFVGNKQLHADEEKSDSIKQDILIGYDIVEDPYNASNTKQALRSLYREFGDLGRKMICHYLTNRMTPVFPNERVISHIEGYHIRSLFNITKSLLPPPDSSSSPYTPSSSLPPPPPMSSLPPNQSTYNNNRTFSIGLGGGSQTRRKLNRRRKQKLSKTRKTRLLVNKNLPS